MLYVKLQNCNLPAKIQTESLGLKWGWALSVLSWLTSLSSSLPLAQSMTFLFLEKHNLASSLCKILFLLSSTYISCFHHVSGKMPSPLSAKPFLCRQPVRARNHIFFIKLCWPECHRSGSALRHRSCKHFFLSVYVGVQCFYTAVLVSLWDGYLCCLAS